METQMIFHILEIPETRELQAIREAYRQKLIKTNPEDDPEGFMRLRTAYEEAVKFAEREQRKESREWEDDQEWEDDREWEDDQKRGAERKRKGRRKQEENLEREKTPLERWLSQVDEVYRDMEQRRDRRRWRELLSDPLCEDLDSFLETREALLTYLIKHCHLPHAVWQLLDQAFQLREDREILEEQFPSWFLENAAAGIGQEDFLPYDLFQVPDRERMDGDAYLMLYDEMKELLDGGWYEACGEMLEELKTFGLYHPYEDAALVRLMTARGQTEEGIGLIRRLLEQYGESSYLCLTAGEAFRSAGEREEAWFWAERAVQEAKRQEEWAEASFFQARILSDRKEYGRCRELCNRIFDRCPEFFPDCISRLEEAFEAEGERRATDAYYQAVRREGWYFDPCFLAAQAFLDHNQPEEAKEALDWAREYEIPFSHRIRLLEIQILARLAQEDDSRDRLITALEKLKESLGPDSDLGDPVQIEYEMFRLLYDKEQTGEAIRYLKKEKASFTSHAYYHYTLGNCYEKAGQEWIAFTEYKECLDYEETYVDACRRLYFFYWNQYEKGWNPVHYQSAMESISLGIAKKESGSDLVLRGRLYAEGYDFDHAMADLEKALTYGDCTSYAYCSMGECLWAMGRLEKAVELFERAAVTDGDEAGSAPFRNAADCCRALGQYSRAIVWCEKGLQRFPDGDKGEIFIKLALCYKDLGNYERALEYLDCAEKNPACYVCRADVYFAMGRKDEGIGFLIQALCETEDPGEQAGILSDLAAFYTKYTSSLERAAGFLENTFLREKSLRKQWDYRLQAAIVFFRSRNQEKARYFGRMALESFESVREGRIGHYLAYLPYHSARLRELGWLYICVGETEKGLACLEEMENYRCKDCAFQGCYESFQSRGFYYEAVGEYGKALECYEKALELCPANEECRLRAAGMREIMERAKEEEAGDDHWN